MTSDDIRAAPLRYIKLGPGGMWAEPALRLGEIYLDHREVPHELAMSGDREAIVAHLVGLGRSPGKAKDFAREIMDFHTLPQETIWITFEHGGLLWAQAAAEVEWIGTGTERGTRCRRTLVPWRDTDLKGAPLLRDHLSTRLTKVAAYRQTLCAIEAEDYLRRKLIGEELPVITRAMEARRMALASAQELITQLHWADFETLVDLLLSRGGWHRTSALGGTMKDADLIVEHPVTGESVLVQVKSKASQSVLDDYIGRLDANPGFSRLIFVCHTPQGLLNSKDRPDITLWSGEALAAAAMRNGLLDWLIARAG